MTDSLEAALDVFDHERGLADLRVSDHADFEDDPGISMFERMVTCEFRSPPSPPETRPLPDPDERYPCSAILMEVVVANGVSLCPWPG